MIKKNPDRTPPAPTKSILISPINIVLYLCIYNHIARICSKVQYISKHSKKKKKREKKKKKKIKEKD